LGAQSFSEVRAGDASMRFTNDIAFFEEEIRRLFPREIDGFVRLKAACAEYPDFSQNAAHTSARCVLETLIADPLLREMLLLPVFFYGSAEENDFDFEPFIILLKYIFEEGF